MAILYTSPTKGYPVTDHSYSAGSLYDDCPKKYDYDRRQGWKEKEKRASSAFGSAVEAAIQYYHNSGMVLSDTIDEWKRLWVLQQDNKELVYSDKDGDWESMYRQGEQMVRLYIAVLPTLPIQNPQFQLNYKKEYYPDTEYAGLKDTAFLDMEVTAPWNHPLLPPLENCPENGQRKIFIDIKTSAALYPVDPRMIKLDPQLRRYAWTSGIETACFLVLVKRGMEFEKGDTVTVLEAYSEQHPVGTELVVLDASKEVLTLLTPKIYDQYDAEAKGLKGNVLKEKKQEFADRFGIQAAKHEVTKQRLQFLAAIISEEERHEAGELAGMQARNICDSNIQNFFPKRPGIKFPNNHCTFCSHLGLCIGDEKMVKNKLIQIGNARPFRSEESSDSDWLEEL